jgi:putative acyl-CoA dehydrogenase
MVAAEALECLGGNGYVEDSGMPRLYREAPLNSIWEGSGNVMALDTLRAMAKQPESVGAFLDELQLAKGENAKLDASILRLQNELQAVTQSDMDSVQAGARRITALMAVTLQASLLVRHAPAEVASAYCGTRLGGDWAGVFGVLPAGTPAGRLTERAFGAN